jgi:hypothetical protein
MTRMRLFEWPRKRTVSCAMRLWAGRPMLRVSFCQTLTLTLDSCVFVDLISCFRAREAVVRGLGDHLLVSSPP